MKSQFHPVYLLLPSGSPAKIWRRATLLLTFLIWQLAAFAQAPTSLKYPPVNSFQTNVDYIYLAPTVSGVGITYAISPALPTGLSFNTATGVISGVPTAGSPNTTYTVTATNASGNTTATFSLQVLNTYYNNSNNAVKFIGTNSEVKLNTAGSGVGGTHTGDIVLYKNVATIAGQQIDCIIKTVKVTGVGDWASYDQNADSGSGFSSNSPAFFSPQVNMLTGGGSITFNFQYILGGTYNNATQSGTNVTLQNVQLNTYDIDGNGTAGSNQYNAFEGFDTVRLGSPTNLVASYAPETGLTRFRSSISTNITNIQDPKTRVNVSYKNMSNFIIEVGSGANGAAWFFLDFSAGPTFTTAVTTNIPALDLNTSLPGNVNGRTGCGAALAFTASGQTNLTLPTGSSISELTLKFPVAQIKNGANEVLAFNGISDIIALNYTTLAATPFTLGSINYSASGSTADGIRTLHIVRSGGGTLSAAETETLLDALQYKNNAANPTAGDRDFRVSVRNATYRSPEALFTATLNCVAISGNIYRDANGLTDNTVNATGSKPQFAANTMYAVLTRQSDDKVFLTQPIAAGGTYSFGTATPDKYHIYIVPSGLVPAAGSVFTTSILPPTPAGEGAYVFTGENLGSGPGNDLLADGKLSVTLGSLPITNANFGLEQRPTTANSSVSVANPMGYNQYTIPNGTFTTADADGTVDSIVITAFPAGANYLRIGSTFYANPTGGVCPPLTTCTPWPGTVRVQMTGGNPAQAISVDPAATTATTVTIPFYAVDNGRQQSTGSSSVTINFTIPTTPLSIAGNVWNDANGNGTKQSGENYVIPADPGQTLYAVLIQTSNTYTGVPTTLYATPVTAGATGYVFNQVPAGNDYQVKIYSLTAAPTLGQAAATLTPHLATGWTGVRTTVADTPSAKQNTNDLTITRTAFTASVTNANFGIEQIPVANNVTQTVAGPAGNGPNVNQTMIMDGSAGNLLPLTGNDPEDGALNATTTNRTVTIISLPVNGTLRYNGTPVTAGQSITSFNAAQLTMQFTGLGYTETSFTYAYVDSAGVPSPAATYAASWAVPLPVKLVSFTATRQQQDVWLQWETAQEANNKGFQVEHSTNGQTWETLGYVYTQAATGNSATGFSYDYRHTQPGAGRHYYRLYQEDLNGEAAYSPVRTVQINDQGAGLQLYPNPAQDVVQVSGIGISAVHVADAQGRRLQVPATQTPTGYQLQVSQLPAGTYFLSVTQAGKVQQYQIQIRR